MSQKVDRPAMTGQDYIGQFNPNDREDIHDIKAAATVLIEVINIRCPPGRRTAIACTHIEEAAMMAVKSLFEEEKS